MTHLSLTLPQSLYRAEQVRALDSIAINEHAIPGMTLMERAGEAAFEALLTQWPNVKQIAVVCGTGNNGGDGYVVARLAIEAGINVRVLQFGDTDRLHGDARQAADNFIASDSNPEPYAIDKIIAADVIVDALLGTGLDREVSGDLKQIIEEINSIDIPVLAIDIPSGLNADTGQVMGDAIKADLTISFIGLKQGLFTGQGRDYCGRILFSDLEVPDSVYSSITPASQRMDFDLLKSLLPLRPRTMHKGDCGHVLVVGGDLGYTGAARMAAEAAARVGSGLVSVATRAEHAAVITAARPEIMAHGVETPTDLLPLLARASVVAIGPGLGQSPWALALFSKVLETELPLVLDADALNLLAKEPSQNNNWVLTPHPGEAARLLACNSAQIQSDRFAAAQELQQRYGGEIVLKGSGTIVVDHNNEITVCTGGNPGMASGGMGDVLTGVIAGLLAQDLDSATAARLGVCLHASAADKAAMDGERGMLASDLMPWIRRLVDQGPGSRD